MAGAILAWLGFRREISKIQLEVTNMHKNVRYAVTCKALIEGLNKRFDSIGVSQKEMRTDMKEMRTDIKELIKK